WKEIPGGASETVGSPSFYNLETGFDQDLDNDGFKGTPPLSSQELLRISNSIYSNEWLEIINPIYKDYLGDKKVPYYIHSGGDTASVGWEEDNISKGRIIETVDSKDYQLFIVDSFNKIDSLIDLDFELFNNNNGSLINIYATAYDPSNDTIGEAFAWDSYVDIEFKITDDVRENYLTIIHEIGHALGLEHPDGDGNNSAFDISQTMMSYNDNQGLKDIWFTESDIHTLQRIWGKESNENSNPISDTTLEIISILTGKNKYSGNITITDANGTNISAADLSTIAGDTTGTVTVSNNINITGTSAEIAAAVAIVDTFGGTPTATLSDAHTLAQLKAINNAIPGTLGLNDYSVALSGSFNDLVAALTGTFASSYKGAIVITERPTEAQINLINSLTAGSVTYEGDASYEIARHYSAAMDSVNLINELMDKESRTAEEDERVWRNVAHLKIMVNKEFWTNEDLTPFYMAISNGTSTRIGTTTEIISILSAIDNYYGNVTITDVPSLAELKFINNATSGTITLAKPNVDFSGSAADFVEAFSGTITEHKGHINLTDIPTDTQLAIINNASNGTIKINGGVHSNDIVKLNTAFSNSGLIDIDLKEDNNSDKVIFKTDNNSKWVTFNNDGEYSNSFAFNKIYNFGNSDQLGIFYGDSIISNGLYQELDSATSAPAFRMRDKIIYEDTFNSDDGLILTNAYVKEEANIRANLQNIIKTGGTAYDINGNSSIDFTYILYSQSSEDTSQVSAYIYTGSYSALNQSTYNDFDNTKLKITGLAEIVNIENGFLNMNNFSDLNY
ncbi:MAG: hypothetical protein CMD04_00620, partial [Flavobacteriales bacterium]|nr:hypothetical protein [Flavobacteriales bacterium]